jgi:phage baseplate assembly protein W
MTQPGPLAPIAVPLQFDGRGRTDPTPTSAHLQDLIEAVVLTSPGERVMRPTFGSGLLQLAFAPNSDQLGATVQMLVQSGLQSLLGNLIAVTDVTIDQTDAAMTVSVTYTVRATGIATTTTFAQLS